MPEEKKIQPQDQKKAAAVIEAAGDKTGAATAATDNKSADQTNTGNPPPTVDEIREFYNGMKPEEQAHFKKLLSEALGLQEIPAAKGETNDLKAAAKSETAIQGTEDETRHLALLKKYGPGYVEVVKKGTNQKQIFSEYAWKNLGPAKKDGSKEGWFPIIKTPPEVKKLTAEKGGK